MTIKQQNQQLEALSAYLDGELSNSENSKLKAMLLENSLLQEQLNGLAKTRQLLRQAPRLKAPRNFTLNAAMLPKKRYFNIWLPIMSTSSALAAVVLMITYLINPFTAPIPLLTQNATAAEMPMAESLSIAPSPEKSTADEAVESPMIIQWFGDLAMGKGGGGGAAPQAALVAEAESLMEETPLNDTAITTDEHSEIQAFTEEAPLTDMALEFQPTPENQASVQEAPAIASSSQPSSELSGVAPAEQSADELTEERAADESPEAMAPAPPAALISPESEALAMETPLDNPILGIPPLEEQGKIIRGEYEDQTIDIEPGTGESQVAINRMLVLRGILLVISLLSGAAAIVLFRTRHS
jgi:hypothetical protein